MNRLVNYGLSTMAIILAGAFAYDGAWWQAVVMCLAAGIGYDNIKFERANRAKKGHP